MATWGDVERLAMSHDDVEESTWFNNRAWKVNGKTFAWVRPLGTKDRIELGDAAPEGPILGLRVADAGEKQAVLAGYEATFTIHHLRNMDAVLVDLDHIGLGALAELIEDAWSSQAPG